MNKLFDLDNPFFRPVWRRVAVVAACMLWGMFELSNGHTEWAVAFLGLGAFTGWRFATIDYTQTPDE